MNTDDFLIEKTIELFELNTGWGDSNVWTNQDFVILSEKIQERTGAALSHVTLKRVWGKVKYDSLPNTHTLDTLVQFVGYENWRAFKSQNANGNASAKTVAQNINNGYHIETKSGPKKDINILKTILFIAVTVALILTIILIYAKAYSFSNKKVVSEGKVKPAIGPTAENALAADQELARAMRDNDTVGIVHMLDKDWAVIATTGGVGEGPSIFPDGIRSGYLTRKTYSLSEPRVRLYGNIALVTTKVETSGMFQGMPFEVTERQTDVWRWKNGAWKCILTHETKMPKV